MKRHSLLVILLLVSLLLPAFPARAAEPEYVCGQPDSVFVQPQHLQ